MTINKTKIILFFKFVAYILVILAIVATPYVIWNGWNISVEWMEEWWLKEKHIVKQALAYKAPRLEELPVEAQIEKVFGKDAPMALAVSQAENGKRDCSLVGFTGDIGVFQINPKYHSWRGNLSNCTENIKIAKQIFEEQDNWTAWTAYNNKTYLKFLK